MANLMSVIRALSAGTLVLAVLSGCAGGLFSGHELRNELRRSSVPPPHDSPQFAPGPSITALPQSGPITLADLFTAAEAQNPHLAAARSEVGVASGQRWQAALYPNPRAVVHAEDVSWGGGLGDAKTTIGITQPIVLGERRAAAMEAADAVQTARVAGVEARRRELFGEIAGEYAGILANRELQALHDELRGVAERTLSIATTRFEARAAPEIDVIRPRVELHHIDAALARLREDQRASARKLSLLLGDLDVDVSRIDGTLPTAPPEINVAEIEASVRGTHPALIAADHELEAAIARVELVKAERTPDLDVGLAVGYTGEREEGVVEIGAGVTVPLWDRRQGDLLSAQFEAMGARERRSALELELLGRLAEAMGDYEAARVQLEVFRDEVVPDAQRAFDQVGAGYGAGRSSFLDVLDAQRTLGGARVALVELGGEVAKARARIIQVVGPELFDLANGPSEPSRSTGVDPMSDERPTGAEVRP